MTVLVYLSRSGCGGARPRRDRGHHLGPDRLRRANEDGFHHKGRHAAGSAHWIAVPWYVKRLSWSWRLVPHCSSTKALHAPISSCHVDANYHRCPMCLSSTQASGAYSSRATSSAPCTRPSAVSCSDSSSCTTRSASSAERTGTERSHSQAPISHLPSSPHSYLPPLSPIPSPDDSSTYRLFALISYGTVCVLSQGVPADRR